MAGLPNKSIAVECSKLQTSPLCPKLFWALLLLLILLTKYWNFIFEMMFSHSRWEVLKYVKLDEQKI